MQKSFRISGNPKLKYKMRQNCVTILQVYKTGSLNSMGEKVLI